MSKIVLPLRGAPPPEPPYGGLGEEGWLRGVTFYDFVDRAGEGRAVIEAAFRECQIPETIVASLGSYPTPVRVMALLDHDDTDSCRIVAQAERLFTCSPRIWMRLFDATSDSELTARYAPDGAKLPILVFFGEDRQEFARWSLADGGEPQSRSLCRLLEAHVARPS